MRRRSVILGVCLLVGFVGAVGAQATPPLKFEVATVKLVNRNAPYMLETIVYPGGRLAMRGVTLTSLVSAAYGMPASQVSGGEPWMRRDLYEIDARPPLELQSRITNLRTTWFGFEDKTLQMMLQSLLQDRFKLDLRRESETRMVYVLEQSGQVLRLKPAASREGTYANLGTVGYVGGEWGISGMSMGQFADFASGPLQAPVLDRTQLEGVYDYRQSEPDPDPKYDDPDYFRQAFLRLIPDLGLRVRRTEATVEKSVIVAAQRPSEN